MKHDFTKYLYLLILSCISCNENVIKEKKKEKNTLVKEASQPAKESEHSKEATHNSLTTKKPDLEQNSQNKHEEFNTNKNPNSFEKIEIEEIYPNKSFAEQQDPIMKKIEEFDEYKNKKKIDIYLEIFEMFSKHCDILRDFTTEKMFCNMINEIFGKLVNEKPNHNSERFDTNKVVFCQVESYRMLENFYGFFFKSQLILWIIDNGNKLNINDFVFKNKKWLFNPIVVHYFFSVNLDMYDKLKKGSITIDSLKDYYEKFNIAENLLTMLDSDTLESIITEVNDLYSKNLKCIENYKNTDKLYNDLRGFNGLNFDDTNSNCLVKWGFEFPEKEVKQEDPIGLRNVGNTCYINSALQAIASTDLFDGNRIPILKNTSVDDMSVYQYFSALIYCLQNNIKVNDCNLYKINDFMKKLNEDHEIKGRHDARCYYLNVINLYNFGIYYDKVRDKLVSYYVPCKIYDELSYIEYRNFLSIETYYFSSKGEIILKNIYFDNPPQYLLINNNDNPYCIYDLYIQSYDSYKAEKTVNNKNMYHYELVSFIKYLPCGGIGHYVTYSSRNGIWYYFNDDQVTKINNIKDVKVKNGEHIAITIYKKDISGVYLNLDKFKA